MIIAGEDELLEAIRRVVREEVERRATPAEGGEANAAAPVKVPVAARAKGVSSAFVRRLIGAGKLRALRAGRQYLVRLADLEAAMAGGAEPERAGVTSLQARAAQLAAGGRR